MKRPFTIQLEDSARNDLEEVAKAAHTDATKYAAQWLSELATIKPEFALQVLGRIPTEWKHRRPGRPTKAPSEPTTSKKEEAGATAA